MDTSSTRVSRCLLAALALACAVLISGCGGGGSSDETTTPPPATSPPQGPPGTLDTTFGTGGTVITPFGPSAFASAVAVQPDGKIVVAGRTGDVGNVPSTFGLVRYNADGTLDSGFGSGGKVVVPSFTFAGAQGVALQSDGKIVAVGQSAGALGAADNACALVRFNTVGSPDVSFGVGGVVLSKLASANVAICTGPALLPSGKIIAAAGGQGSIPAGIGAIAAMQFNSDGTRDLSFGVGGEVVAPTLYDHNEAWSIAVQPDGKIIVGGFTKSSSFLGPIVGQYVMARFSAGGAPDSAFGQGGVVSGTVANTWTPPIAAVLLQSDGKIVAVIWGDILRFLPNGTLDPGFGVGGTLADVWAFGGALQSNGKIVTAGEVDAHGTPGFAVSRFGPDGALDPSFGTGGSVTALIGVHTSSASAVAIEPDGRIVVVGGAQSTYDPANPLAGGSFAVARYFGDPVAVASP